VEAHIDSNDRHEYYHSHRPSRPHKFSPIPKPSRNQHARVAQTKRYNGNLKCWGCGRNHHLRDCPTTSMETRHQLWEEYREKRKPKTNMRYINDVPAPHQRKAPPNAHTDHSHTASHDTDDAIAPNQKTFPPKHTKISMRNKRSEKAQAVLHSVNTTQQRTIPRHTAKKAEWHPNTPNDVDTPPRDGDV
jgi:hypothetical protein